METLPAETLDELRRFTTPSICNGIERFKVRPRSEGFMNHGVRCMLPELGVMTGYAVTARIRAAAKGDQVPGSALWEHALSVPEPRVVVVEDLDDPPGAGSYWGEVNANLFRALGCAGVVTNGCVRDLIEMEELGFRTFAGSVGVSHAYVHLVDVGGPVRVGGLEVRPGDLLHGDRHGVTSIPLEIAADLPAAVREVEQGERQIIDLCRNAESPESLFSTLTGGEPSGDVRH